MYLKSIENLRGIAIIAIVSCHLFNFGLVDNDLTISFIKNTLVGTSALYVFISGYMFHYVFYKRFKYRWFIVKKLKAIAIPYFILSTLAIFLLWNFNMGYFTPIENMRDPIEAFRNGNIFSPGDSNFEIIIKYYASGRMMTAYWYIPFAILLFLSSPLHVKFIEASLKTKVYLVVFLSILALFAHRPVSVTNPLHSYLFYTPFYLYGIVFSIYKDEMISFIRSNIKVLIFLVIMLISTQVYLGDVGNYTKPLFYYDGMDLQFLQKVAFISVLFFVFEKYAFNNNIITVLSKFSFSIYLIHPWVIIVLYHLGNHFGYLINDRAEENNIALFIFMTGLVLLTSVAIAATFKWLLRGNRRTIYITGY
ncbi:TPA: acyltransferase [Vibrio campbellii]|nr:acyltransferase [Vibrio campbellii]